MIIFSKRRGFTLIELLVVISIIGLLSSIVLSSLNSARIKAQDAVRKQNIVQIQKALELYYDANGQYPPSGGTTLVPPLSAGWSNSADSSWTTLETALKMYIPSLPKDPDNKADNVTIGPNTYSYYSLNGGCAQQYYILVYSLKVASGPDSAKTNCSGTTYQYGCVGINTSIKTAGSKFK